MLVDIKLSKAQLSKIIQSGGDLLFRGQLIQAKKAPIIVTIPLPRDDFPGLVSNLASNAINNFERKISRKGAVRAGKGFNLFIWNEDMIDINKIIKSLEDSNALKHETSKHETKKQEGVFFPTLLAILAVSLVLLVEEQLEEQKEDIQIKIFGSTPSFKRYRDY